MKKSIFLWLCIGLLCHTSILEAKNEEGETEVDSVKIVAYSFQPLFIVGQTTRSLLLMCNKLERKGNNYGTCENILIKDEEFTGDIARRIDSLIQKGDTLDAEYTAVDVRVAVLLYKGERIDTISFGPNAGISPPSMIVNSKYYRVDRTLLHTISNRVLQMREDILHYLNVSLPQYDKLLDDYYREHPEEPDRR